MVVLFLVPVFLLIFAFFMLLPATCLWVSWTWWGIGERFFSFLPEQFHVLAFWDCFFLMMALGTISSCITGAYARSLQRIGDKCQKGK